MILNNLQKTKQKKKTKSIDKDNVYRKIFIQTSAKRNSTYRQVNTSICLKCRISKAMDGLADVLFQMDSFDRSDYNFEDYSSKNNKKNFRKRAQGHPSYF